MYCVYILHSHVDVSYYVGSTQNIEERVARHNAGRSKYTKAKRPWELVYIENQEDRSTAVRREKEIKAKKSRAYIEQLVSTPRRLRIAEQEDLLLQA